MDRKTAQDVDRNDSPVPLLIKRRETHIALYLGYLADYS